MILAATALAGVMPVLAQTVPAPLPTVAMPVTTPTPIPAASPPPVPAAPPIVHRRKVPPSPAELRIRAANRAATQEPAGGGFINAVQVYPWSEGAIYRVYTTPGRVTDIALQIGRAPSELQSLMRN